MTPKTYKHRCELIRCERCDSAKGLMEVERQGPDGWFILGVYCRQCCIACNFIQITGAPSDNQSPDGA